MFLIDVFLLWSDISPVWSFLFDGAILAVCTHLPVFSNVDCNIVPTWHLFPNWCAKQTVRLIEASLQQRFQFTSQTPPMLWSRMDALAAASGASLSCPMHQASFFFFLVPTAGENLIIPGWQEEVSCYHILAALNCVLKNLSRVLTPMPRRTLKKLLSSKVTENALAFDYVCIPC